MIAHRKPAEPAIDFVRRHIGPSPRDIAAMLERVGANSLTELMSQTLPSSIRQKAPLDLGRALSETEALSHMARVDARVAANTPEAVSRDGLAQADQVMNQQQSIRVAEQATPEMSPPALQRA